MSLLQSCRALRADMAADGGTADRPTLARIAARTASAQLASDARQAEGDAGDDIAWRVDADLLAHDCRGAGVQIPAG